MSGFSPFVTTLGKFSHVNYADIISDKSALVLISEKGRVLYQTRAYINAYRKSIEEMYKIIPLIEKGPQIEINNCYMRLSSISSRVSTLVQSFDSGIGSGLNTIAYINDSFRILTEFSQYIPQLISTSASSYSAHIGGFQQLILQCCSHIDNIISVLNSVEHSLIQEVTATISSDQHLSIAILSTVDLIGIDFCYLSVNEALKNDESVFQSINQWLNSFLDLSDSIYNEVRNQSNCLPSIQKIINTHTPFVDVLSSIFGLVPNIYGLHSIILHAIRFIQLLNELEFKNISDSVLQYSESLSSLIGGNNINNAIIVAQQALVKFSDSLSLSYSPPHGKDTLVVKESLSSLLRIGSEKTEWIPFAIFEIYRCYAAICPIKNYGIRIVYSLIDQLVLILQNLGNKCVDLSQQIHMLIINNIAVFDEKSLNLYNFYYNMIRNINIPFGDSINSELRNITCSCYGIPHTVNLLLSSNTNEELSSQIKILSSQISEIGDSFCKWLHQFILCYTTLNEMKAENIAYLASFSSTLIDNQEIVQQYSHSSVTVLTLLQSTPRYILYDFREQQKLSQSLIDADEKINNFVSELCGPENTSRLNVFIGDSLKQPIDTQYKKFSLYDYVGFSDSGTFVAFLSTYLHHFSLYLDFSLETIQKDPVSFTYFFSLPHSLSTTIGASIQHSQAFAMQIMHFPMTIKGSLDVMWPMATNIAIGKSQNEAEHLPMYGGVFRKIGIEMQNSVSSMPAPSLSFEIPEYIRKAKTLYQLNSRFPSNIQDMGQRILQIVTRSKCPDVIQEFSLWFEMVQKTRLPLAESLKSSVNSLKQSIIKNSHDTLIKDVMGLLVSSISISTDIDESLQHIVYGIVSKIVHSTVAFIEIKDNPITKINLFLNIGCVNEVLRVSSLKSSEVQDNLVNSMTMALIILSQLKDKDTVDNRIRLIEYTVQIEALYIVWHQSCNFFVEKIISTVDILKSVLNNYLTIDIIIHAISAISSLIDGLMEDITISCPNDNVEICDLVYDYSTKYRNYVNYVLKEVSSPAKDIDMIFITLRKMSLAAISVVLITQHFLINSNLNLSPLVQSFIEGSVIISSSLAGFIKAVVALKTSNLSTEIEVELRRNNRKIAKEIGAFINFVENTPSFAEELSPFDKLRRSMLSSMANLIRSSLYSCYCSSMMIVPEMRNRISGSIDAINESIKQFKVQTALLVKSSVGKSAEDFIALFQQLETAMKSYSLIKIPFEDDFPPQSVYDLTYRLTSSMNRFAKASLLLTDTILLEPDPIAAEKVPSSYRLPTIQQAVGSPQDIYLDVQTSHQDLLMVIKSFQTIKDKAMALPNELLESITNLIGSLDKFCSYALLLAVSTPDSRLQVEQQTSIHTIAGNMNMVLSAMKSRILLTPSHAQEMDDAFGSFNASLASHMRIAENASKLSIDTEEPDEATDAVTSELKATAQAISQMSQRLAQFSAELNVNTVEVDNLEDEPEEETQEVVPDATIMLPVEEGSISGFIISYSTPIMTAAGQILSRAQEITKQLIATLGHLDNERLLIKSAQDLSEAAQLLIICAEIVVSNQEPEPEYKVIAASKIIRATVSSLVAQVLVQGGDPEGIMNTHVRTVKKCTAKVISKFEKIVRKRMQEEHAKAKKVTNKMVAKMNANNKLAEIQKLLQEEEKALYAFRKKG